MVWGDAKKELGLFLMFVSQTANQKAYLLCVESLFVNTGGSKELCEL